MSAEQKKAEMMTIKQRIVILQITAASMESPKAKGFLNETAVVLRAASESYNALCGAAMKQVQESGPQEVPLLVAELTKQGHWPSQN